MSQSKSSNRASLPLRWHLVLLVVGTLLPVVGFSAALVWRLAEEQRAAATHRLAYSARLMSDAVERELSSSIRALAALAESDILDTGDLHAFYREAQRVQRTQRSWVAIILLSPDGQQLLATDRRWGIPLPKAVEPESLRRLVDTGQPLVGYVVRDKESGGWAFPLRVPVRRRGKIRYVLTAVITTEALTNVVVQQLPPQEEWVRVVTDGRGTIAARTRNPGQYVGKASADWSLERYSRNSEGVVRAAMPEGMRVYSAYHRSTSSGWSSEVAAPVEVIDGPVVRSVLVVAGSGLCLLLLSAAGAYGYSRRVAHGIAAAAAAADALAHGRTPRAAASPVAEVHRLGEALDRSAELLCRRERERDENLAAAEAARAEAEVANRSKDEFLAMLGHELRNPLASIVLGLGILDRRGQAQTREWLVIDRQVKLVCRLVDDLLDVARITRGKLVLRRERVEIHVAVARAVEMAQTLIDERGHRLTVDTPELGLEIDADPLRVAQVVGNLLTNAARYTPDGGEIRVCAGQLGEWVQVEVTDTGRGLTADLLPRVFEPFVQGPRPTERQEGGLGIGLALVRNLVVLHGGEVEAESDGPDRGSTFRVRFPAAPA